MEALVKQREAEIAASITREQANLDAITERIDF